MARLYVLTGCRSVVNPTCFYSSILAMFFSGVRFVSVNVSDAYRSAKRVRCAQNQAKQRQKQDHNFAGFRFQHAKW